MARLHPETGKLFYTKNYITPQSELTQPVDDGVYTLDGSPSVGSYTWKKPEVTYSVTLENNQKFVDIPDTHDIVISTNMAFTVWRLYGGIKFTKVPYTPDVDISIHFSATDSMFNTPGVMAYTYFPNTRPQGEFFTSVYNMNILWSETGKYNFAYNINETLRHELGHSWGAVHTTNQNDIMYPFYHNSLRPTKMDVYQCVVCCGERSPLVNTDEIESLFVSDSNLNEFPDKPVIERL